MTWTKLSDTFADDPVILSLCRDDRLLHVETLVWCNRQLTDGAVPAAALPRLTDHPDPRAGADRLVAAGLWTVTGSGWQVDWTDQRSRADVDQDRERARQRQERSRLHRSGDHSSCDPQWCPQRRNGVSHGVTDAVNHSVGHRTPTRPDPTRPVKGGEGGKGLRTAGALEAPDGPPSEGKGAAFSVSPPPRVCVHGNSGPCAQCRQSDDPRPTVRLT